MNADKGGLRFMEKRKIFQFGEENFQAERKNPGFPLGMNDPLISRPMVVIFNLPKEYL
jgi:hypothetical protein